ncbi:MAG: 2-C-methyl-D-erythritol 4-phosphate cytidylyltransferase [Lachnospiraceae bacterium]|nr:2-C-methyl-D-erythritol 4-phosphate cytidylyltransferase [Lachnospiraceae bacterium]MDD7025744.1 2-C-methyl-D-erythritol 4-phosphate cytidylyltransferase [Lachnospiraceae bacterium]MDY5700740.1 2-C-methyl-D-erythritol 4-phosphate cytidylyltransferase [Lachnospiraceae bacterium]
MQEKKIAAVCLAAGRGKRMESKVQKQYLLLGNKPILYYSLAAFENSRVDSVILVVGTGEEEYCRKEIVEAYGFTKVKAVVPGGKERYHSVYQGLLAAGACDYVLIHDGARPFLNQEIIERCIEGAKDCNACVAGMPVKDTIKLADADQNIETTPDRSRVWMIQTPQAFSFPLIKEAYSKLMALEAAGKASPVPVTDDAMVVEYFLGEKVRLVQGSYENIKITTPEDMKVAEAFLDGFCL